MIDVILPENTRPACGGPQLILYSAAGVFLALRQKGLDVRWCDLMSEEGGDPSPKKLEHMGDVCCYAVFFGNKSEAFRLMKEARLAQKPPRLIIAFGPFSSVFSEEMLSRGLADIVVNDDPEFVIPALLNEGEDAVSKRIIPNLSYLHEKKIVHTSKHAMHELDLIPFIGPFLYAQGHRPGLMMTARGCQYHCVFCDRNVLWGGKVRNRSVEHVINEIEEFVEVNKVRKIRFLDEDLAADHKRLAAICQGMLSLKSKFEWECSACVNSVSQKMLLLMARAGCRGVSYGVESASWDVLRKIGKTYTREEILNAVQWAKEVGIKVGVQITIGNPGEREADRDLTLSALKELGSEVSVRTNRLVILPGTAFYRKGLSAGWFTQKSFFEDEGLIFYDAAESQGNALAHKNQDQ